MYCSCMYFSMPRGASSGCSAIELYVYSQSSLGICTFLLFHCRQCNVYQLAMARCMREVLTDRNTHCHSCLRVVLSSTYTRCCGSGSDRIRIFFAGSGSFCWARIQNFYQQIWISDLEPALILDSYQYLLTKFFTTFRLLHLEYSQFDYYCTYCTVLQSVGKYCCFLQVQPLSQLYYSPLLHCPATIGIFKLATFNRNECFITYLFQPS